MSTPLARKPSRPSSPPTPDDFSPTVKRQVAFALARADLGVYGHLVHELEPAPHHLRWIDAIHGLIEQPGGRLLVIAPPGHAKSTWLSLIFPSWYLGKHPDHHLLFVTSADTMGRKFATTVKATLEANERHAAVFPKEAARPDEGRGWSSDGLYLRGTPAASKDPAYQAVGYGSTIVGARAHGLILDDPLTQEEARNPEQVDKALDYWKMTLSRRLLPQGWAVAIMTRWAELDLAGKWLEQGGWTYLNLPALGAYPWGDSLWPQMYPRLWLEKERRGLGGDVFNCVYQGDPTGLGGDVFKSAAWFRALPQGFVHLLPKLTRVQFWDLAWSENKKADDTAAITVSVNPLDPQRTCYVTGIFSTKRTEDRLAQSLAEHILTTRPAIVGVEVGAYKQASTRNLITQVLTLLSGRHACAVVPVQVTTDKVFRARLPASRAEAGLLYVDKGLPEAEPFIAQCLGFPRAAHDDYVDALSGAVQIAVEGQVQAPTRRRMGG